VWQGLRLSEPCASSLAEIQIITARELRKSFWSVKGIVFAAVSIAGGPGVLMLLEWLDGVQRERLTDVQNNEH